MERVGGQGWPRPAPAAVDRSTVSDVDASAKSSTVGSRQRVNVVGAAIYAAGARSRTDVSFDGPSGAVLGRVWQRYGAAPECERWGVLAVIPWSGTVRTGRVIHDEVDSEQP